MGILKRHGLIGLLMLSMVSGCAPGGNDSNAKPSANAGPDITARFGTEIVLSGRSSLDSDGPILEFDWQQVEGPDVELAAVVNSTVKFTLPIAAQPVDLVFELTVTDNQGKTDTDTVVISAVGPVDPDRFLTFLSVPSRFVVEVSLNNDIEPLTDDVNFDVVMTATQYYQTLNGSIVTRILDTQIRSGHWNANQQNDKNFPRFDFDIPSARIEDVVDANKSARNDLDVVVTIALMNVTAAVDYKIQLLDENGSVVEINDAISTNVFALADAPQTFTMDLNALLGSLGNGLVENRDTALAYYAAIDPDQRKTTLNDWLQANGYDEAQAARARYINGGDLGFGRDMRVWANDLGHVFAFVENYPNMDSLVRGASHMGTVAMEYSPGPNGGQPYTKFYTFVHDPEGGEKKRVVSMDFDGRGEKFTPGNCMACHGGKPLELQNGVYPDDGNVDAGFILWDLSTFSFSDAEFEGRAAFFDDESVSKNDQQFSFKAMNEMLLLTNLKTPQRDLIAGWYGGDTLPSNIANQQYVPIGWRAPDDGGPSDNPDSAAELYLQVLAPSCRMCHNGFNSQSLQFSSYTGFFALKDTVVERVFDQGVMPLTRVAMDHFWLGTAATQNNVSPTRAQRLAEHFDVDLQTRYPGRPQAIIESRAVNGSSNDVLPSSQIETQRTVLRGDSIYLNGLSSLFAHQQQWSLLTPSDSHAQLSDVEQAVTAFVADTHGDFMVDISVANHSGDTSTQQYIYHVDNLTPEALIIDASVKSGKSVIIDVLNQGVTLGDGARDEHQISYVSAALNDGSVNTAYFDDQNIEFFAGDVGEFSFDFRVIDVDGDESNSGTINVTVTEALNASNDTLSAFVGTQSDDRILLLDTSVVFANDNYDAQTTELSIEASPVTAFLENGLGACDTNQVSGLMLYYGTNTLSYVPPQGCVGTETYEYVLTDPDGETSSATITVNVGRTAAGAFSNVATAISNKGCAACHTTSHVMQLNGSDASKWSQLLECNAGGTPDHSYDCYRPRVDLDDPASSYLLTRPLGPMDYLPFVFPNTSDADYQRILHWIEEGVAQP